MKKLLTALAGLSLMFSGVLVASAATLSTPLTVGTSFPNLGGSTTVSGNCGSVGANGLANFSLVQNGTTTNLTGSNLATNATGAFSGNLSFPTSFGSGNATLVATCPNGDVINSSTLTFPAAASTSFNIGATSPFAGGTFNLTGACGGSNGSGVANLSVLSNGTTTSLGSTNLSATGTFNNNVVIPSTVASGPATITATCSNGTTFSSPVTINPAAVSSFNISGIPTIGGNNNVTGTCNGTGNSNAAASFSLVSNGISTPLTTLGNMTNASGQFSSMVSFPASFASGPTTLVVTCPSGATFARPLTLSAASITDPGTAGSGTTSTSTTGGVGGVSDTMTPTGGVNAGTPPANTTPALIWTALLIAAGLGGIAAARRLNQA